MTRPVRRERHQNPKTPIRAALHKESALKSIVKDGLGALKSSHRSYFEDTARVVFADSLDIDEGLRENREQENRWDYLLGHKTTKAIIAVEPHSADNSEIRTIIRKREAAIRQLEGHLLKKVRISKWIWVASGTVRFLPLDKKKLLLDQNGIEFIGGKIRKQHLC